MTDRGVGLGWGGAANAQIGLTDMDDPKDLAGFGLEVSAFAAAGSGASLQVTGTGPFDGYAFGAAGGYSAGAGAGISGLVTHTWYQGTWNLSDLPSGVSDALQPYLPGMLGKRGPW